MAGVYIKGKNIPYGCAVCPCHNWEQGFCQVFNDFRVADDSQTRPDWCPLVEVPDHGDLIDANTKIGVELYDECREEWYEQAMTVWEYLGHASTTNVQIVIPAERSYECD